jgi:GR25 family glycosyltransferase involved in LPS biosynthesis
MSIIPQTFYNSILEEYYFIQDKDSIGNDIDFLDSLDINTLKNIADNNNECIAFNTWGYFKNKISNENEYIDLPNKYHLKYNGLFIKKNKVKLPKIKEIENENENEIENEIENENKNEKIKDKLPIICLNLERRKDRKTNMIELFKKKNIKNYEFFKAIDCKELQPTEYIKNLFNNNNFKYRKSIIACALSHFNIWNKLINDNDNEAYIILEDDIEIVDNFDYFNNQLNNIINNNSEDEIDIIFIGYFKLNKKANKVSLYNLELKINPLNMSNFKIGGSFGYVITKKAAQILINNNNIKKGIDWELLDNGLKVYETNFELVRSEYVNNVDNIDSDIQYNYEVFNFDLINKSEEEKQNNETEQIKSNKTDLLENEIESACFELLKNNDNLYLIINEDNSIYNKLSYLDESLLDKFEEFINSKIDSTSNNIIPSNDIIPRNDIDIVFIGYYIDPQELYNNYEKYNIFNDNFLIENIDKLEDNKIYAYYITKTGAKKILNKEKLSYYKLYPRLIY